MNNNSKNVLLITSQPFFEWRGSPIRVFFILKALSSLGYNVDFLTLPYGKDREIENVKIIRVPNFFMKKTIPIGPSIKKLFFDFIILIKGLHLISKNKYDVIHSIEDASIPGIILAKLSKTKHIIEKHSDTDSYKKGFLKNIILSIYQNVERIIIKNSNSFIGTGPKLKESALKIAPLIKSYHIFDIPSSLEEPDKDESIKIRDSFKNINKDSIIILYVGSFAIYQGIELLFDSIPLVVNKNQNAHFIIIGGTEKEINDKNELLKQNNIEDCVTFLGKIPPDELPNYLRASDILLSPRIKGFNTPLKLLDYLKVGRPIVATNALANKQILNNKNSILTKMDKDSFSNGILKLLDDKELRDKLSKNSRKLIDEKYNFNEFTKLLQICYKIC